MSPSDAAWTIDQLTERVADALAAGYEGQANGRVRDVPNIRTIRWYTTIGLLDRPAAMQGRTALYGRRHLAQIVAIKRLQAEGGSLAEVQERLIGADDATLLRIARLRDAEAPAAEQPQGTDHVPDSHPARSRFWSAAPAAATAAPGAESTAPTTPASAPAPPSAPLIHGVRLSEDVTLLLTASRHLPDESARRTIEEAAKPLLAQLRKLGLTED
jgi:DNA-binding transcriptional MerR regulator